MKIQEAGELFGYIFYAIWKPDRGSSRAWHYIIFIQFTEYIDVGLLHALTKNVA